MQQHTTLTEKIGKFESDLKALETLGLEIISEATDKSGSQGNLSKLIYSDKKDTRSNLATSLNRIQNSEKTGRSKIGLLVELVRRVKKIKFCN